MGLFDDAFEKLKRGVVVRRTVVLDQARTTTVRMSFDRDAVVVWSVAMGLEKRAVTAESLLAAALEDRALAAMFSDAARRELADTPSASAGAPSVATTSSGLTRRAVARARDHARASISRGDLLHAIGATASEAGRLVREAGLDLHRLDGPREDRMPEEAVDPATHGSLAVHALDDDASEIGDVVTVLQESFAIPAQRALYVALRAHHVGHGRIGAFASAEALARVNHASTRARGRRMPLAFRLAVEA
jgi:ATP-dependent Clp protease adapter protein ClpS